jgi:hypothetical protein
MVSESIPSRHMCTESNRQRLRRGRRLRIGKSTNNDQGSSFAYISQPADLTTARARPLYGTSAAITSDVETTPPESSHPRKTKDNSLSGLHDVVPLVRERFPRRASSSMGSR